ncbi:hypothetical protein F4805DRAFT_451366 [Annulohypoxylon moriforme]|nr:hypothetical protein F4805DRAFT_451366 [Annulohypoxylon moriforme]
MAMEDNIQPRTSSQRKGRFTTRMNRSTQTPDRLQKSERPKSTPSLFRDKAHGPTTQKRNISNFTPESQIKGDFPTQHKITLRSILGLNKNRGKSSDTNPSETISISPPRASMELDVLTESWRRKWWESKKKRNIRNYERHKNNTPCLIEPPLVLDENEECDGLAALRKPQGTWKDVKNRHKGRNQKGETTKNALRDGIGRISTKSERSTRQREEIYRGASKTTRYTSPLQQLNRGFDTSGNKIQMDHRKSISSSQAHPSTIETNSTPGTATVHRDFAQDDWRETPSPITPTQVLRFFLSPRRSSLSKTATQLDLSEGPKISVSTCTPPLGRQSRESHGSGRPSAEHRNRTWIPFRVSPRPQPGHSFHDNGEKSSRGEGQGGHLEPIATEPVPSKSPTLKKSWGRILRKRWRSG